MVGRGVSVSTRTKAKRDRKLYRERLENELIAQWRADGRGVASYCRLRRPDPDKDAIVFRSFDKAKGAPERWEAPGIVYELLKVLP
jgi:hypothetical protein